MLLKVNDGQGRWRNRTVAFQVSPEEDTLLEIAVALSGLTKQDYITRRLQCRDVVTVGNPRVYKALRNQLAAVFAELQRIAVDESNEATPYLHVDFVPFITGSKRGLDTRVSLKQALAVQGFTGGTRGDTEWNQWVRSEKEQLSEVMERHGIEWERLGTHEAHLSVENFKKEQRAKKVAVLDEQITEKTIEVSALTDKRSEVKGELSDFLQELEKTQGKEVRAGK